HSSCPVEGVDAEALDAEAHAIRTHRQAHDGAGRSRSPEGLGDRLRGDRGRAGGTSPVSYFSDETYAVYQTTGRKARKPADCGASGDKDRPNDGFTRVVVLFDGRTETINGCSRCQKLPEDLRGLCREHRDGEFWPDERFACGLDYREEWGSDPPPEIAALAFAL